jgi:hypothetical protein
MFFGNEDDNLLQASILDGLGQGLHLKIHRKFGLTRLVVVDDRPAYGVYWQPIDPVGPLACLTGGQAHQQSPG